MFLYIIKMKTLLKSEGKMETKFWGETKVRKSSSPEILINGSAAGLGERGAAEEYLGLWRLHRTSLGWEQLPGKDGKQR